MAPTPPPFEPSDLVAGVDTHSGTHTLAILTAAGSTVSTATFPADAAGYRALIAAMGEAGTVAAVGVEGTGSYGAGLTRALAKAGYRVQEVLRPARRVRRLRGKSDPIDAVEAARTVLSGNGVSEPKDTDTAAESVRLLLAARAQLVHAATILSNTITSLMVTAPEELRARYRGLPSGPLARRLAATRPAGEDADPGQAAARALRELAQARLDAAGRADDLEARIRRILEASFPRVLAIYGAGTVVAAKLVATAGGNPARIRGEAAFAMLCGAAPIPASSGKTTRHRLNRGGDRRGNSALHRIALVRMQHDKPTQDYIARRRAEGKTTKEILRCLKRAIAREAYRALTAQNADPTEKPDLRGLRQARHLTITAAAQALGTWPARISDIETGRRPLPELTERYRQWLAAA